MQISELFIIVITFIIAFLCIWSLISPYLVDPIKLDEENLSNSELLLQNRAREQSLAISLAELEHDFLTQKIDEKDYSELQESLISTKQDAKS
jgi:hypothetical protein